MGIGRWAAGIAMVATALAQGCQTVNRKDAADAFDLAQRYRTDRNFDEAIRLCRRAADLEPANAAAHALLGTYLREVGRYTEASAAFRKAWETDPSLYDARLKLWDVELNDALWTKEAREKVKVEIDRMLAERERTGAIDEKFLDFVQSAYGMIHSKDDISDIFDFKKYQKYLPKQENKEEMGASSAFWGARGKEPLAKRVEAFEGFVAQYPRSEEWTPYAYRWMLDAWKEGDLVNHEKLKTYGERWIADMPDLPAAWLGVSRSYVDAGIELPRAVEYAVKAVELIRRPEQRSKIDNEKSDPEIATYREMLAAYIDNLAWTRFRSGDLAGAEQSIDDALRHNPDSSNIHYHRGAILEQKGDPAAAVEAYARALTLGNNKKAQESLAAITQRESMNPVDLRRRLLDRAEGASVLFVDATVEAGLVDEKGNPLKFGSVSWGDYDGDGFIDLFLGNRLYRNDGKGRFEDVTAICGLKEAGGIAGYWGDYDNDGNLDLFVIHDDPKQSDRLFRNAGEGRFVDVTEKAGVLEPEGLPGQAAAWGDYDADGFVDLYVANHEGRGLPRSRGTPDKLYHNNKDGTFTEVSKSVGAAPPVPLCGRGVSWGDFDNDGDLDLYVQNYRLNPNLLFVNQGKGTFANEAKRRGVEGVEAWANDDRTGPSYFGHTIGAAWGDYDNDGDLDLFCANLAHPRFIAFSNKSMLYRNNGKESGFTFSDVRVGSGIKYEETHSQPAWGDYDNDGFLDLAVTSVYEGRFSFLYRNRGDGKFSDVTWLTGTRTDGGWGCAWGDYDNDGHLDLLVAGGVGLRLYRNLGGANGWLKVRLKANHCNRCAIGARVTVSNGRMTRIREIEGGSGTASQNAMEAHFGLGTSPAPAVTVEVRWPCGKTWKKDVAVNRIIEIVESVSE